MLKKKDIKSKAGLHNHFNKPKFTMSYDGIINSGSGNKNVARCVLFALYRTKLAVPDFMQS